MKLDDEQLDQLLKHVAVPPDLKARLHRLPELDLESNGESNGEPKLEPTIGRIRDEGNWQRMAIGAGILIAASVLLLLSLIWIPVTESGSAKIEPDPLDTPAQPIVRQQLAEIQTATDRIDAMARRMEIERLRQQWSARRLPSARTMITPTDETSMILSLSQLSALEWGADPRSVERELIQVSRDYPDTRGASLASEIIQDIHQQ